MFDFDWSDSLFCTWKPVKTKILHLFLISVNIRLRIITDLNLETKSSNFEHLNFEMSLESSRQIHQTLASKRQIHEMSMLQICT